MPHTDTNLESVAREDGYAMLLLLLHEVSRVDLGLTKHKSSTAEPGHSMWDGIKIHPEVEKLHPNNDVSNPEPFLACTCHAQIFTGTDRLHMQEATALFAAAVYQFHEMI